MNGQNPGAKSSQALLKVESVSKVFNGIHVLNAISFEVQPGSIYAVVGPDGAGKTTLINVITSVCIPEQGRVIYRGEEIQGKKVHEPVGYGISRTFQNLELFQSMTVLENVLVGEHVRMECGFLGAIARWPWVKREENKAHERALDLLHFVGLDDLAYQRSTDLSPIRQRLLGIARALASEPRLLFLDESASGLNSVETQQLIGLLEQLKKMDITLILAEHDMRFALAISDQIFVLNQGRKLAEGTPEEIQANEAVMSAYFGTN